MDKAARSSTVIRSLDLETIPINKALRTGLFLLRLFIRDEPSGIEGKFVIRRVTAPPAFTNFGFRA